MGGVLADQLILLRAAAGALPVLTFDQRLSASDGSELLGADLQQP
jgi:hypothetical protein